MLTVHLLILALLILLNAFFALSEIAVVTVNDKKIKKLSSQGNTEAMRVLKLLSNSNDFLATIQVGITFSGFLTSASASQSFADPLAESLKFLPVPEKMLASVATIVITFILSYFSLVFGELVPKKIAMQNPEKVSFKIAGILLVFSKIFKPFIKFLSLSSDLIVRCFGVDPNKNEETVTEEEILMMVDAGQEKGLIEDKAKSIISKVFDFDNTPVSEVMTHRVDITAVSSEMSLNQVIDLAMKEGRSRLPVYSGDIDHISGMLYIKDALKFINQEIPYGFKIMDLVRQPIFVPATKRCDELFAEFTSSKRHIAIVVDEYGGTEGLVTIEDLVESILGNIQDEYDNEKEEIHKISEGSFVVDGSTPIDEIAETLKSKIPDGDYDTIAGFISDKLGKVPEKDEFVILEPYKFIVTEVSNRRVTKVSISKSEDKKIVHSTI
ncbi:MAG: HlyC/CorC family transporter [Clostridia bacterium]|nr:HlyC/CorC family transporter [Clostridia bacterium]